ncbi:MAG: DUF459 domain-containing protein [Methylobacteriaceae bacterium]|nr:DUF459 domain-containing protein [Methylobacteriaceae bacterium]
MIAFLAGRARRAVVTACCRIGHATLAFVALLSAQALAQPAVAEIRIAFVGDSMSDGIWGGLVRMTSTDPCLKGQFDLGRFGNNGTGLTRPDRFDWPQEVKRIMTTFRPDLLVVSLGLNDRQFIVDVNAGKAHIEYGTPEWIPKYTEQVTAFLQNGSEARAGLLWIGIPVMRDPVANNDALEKNKIYSGAIANLGNSKVQFVQPWRLNPNGPEAFKSIGPGRDGSIIALRAPDGVHFTSAGYDMLASYLYPKIVENLEQNQIAVPRSCGKQAGHS